MIKVGLYIDDFHFGTRIADSLSMANLQFKFFDKNDFNCNDFNYIIIDLDDLNNYNEIKLNDYKSAFSKTIVIVTSDHITKGFVSSIKKLGWKLFFSKSILRKNLINILNDVSL